MSASVERRKCGGGGSGGGDGFYVCICVCVYLCVKWSVVFKRLVAHVFSRYDCVCAFITSLAC